MSYALEIMLRKFFSMLIFWAMRYRLVTLSSDFQAVNIHSDSNFPQRCIFMQNMHFATENIRAPLMRDYEKGVECKVHLRPFGSPLLRLRKYVFFDSQLVGSADVSAFDVLSSMPMRRSVRVGSVSQNVPTSLISSWLSGDGMGCGGGGGAR